MLLQEMVVCVLLAASVSAMRQDINLIQRLENHSKGQSTLVVANRFNDQQVVVAEAPKPVNERFPSAVLFGRTCGGTILSEKWVLSAGHCTLFTGGREVLAGTNNTENGSGVRRRVKKLYIHRKFTVGPYWLDPKRFSIQQVPAHWDFLLAELEEPLPLNGKTIKAATLPSAETPAGTPVGYGGFGAEKHGETMRHEMHGMDLRTISDAECASLEQFDSNDMLCARGVAPRFDSACNGDSGSGLVDSENTLIGVASWVEDDAFRCFSGAKVVFGKVRAARLWINEITGL